MQFVTRMVVDDEFPYNHVFDHFSEKQLESFEDWIYKRHHKSLQNSFTIKSNSEWITRNYLSSKMILSASVMASSLYYAKEKNLNITIPYLCYYSIITCCRALLYANPYNEWKDNSSFLNTNHSKIINLTKDYLNHLDKDYALKTTNILNELKISRELFSYKFPSSGLDFINEYDIDEIIEICSTLCELAQFTSEQIQKYVLKKCIERFEEWNSVDINYLKHTYSYNGITDSEDWYRVDYIRRKQPFPASIYYTMTEGMVEDYFGAWCPEEEDEELYDPDINWRILFPVP